MLDAQAGRLFQFRPEKDHASCSKALVGMVFGQRRIEVLGSGVGQQR